MASNINITLKRNNGTDYDVLYPKTIPSQVVGLLTDGKITTSLLPNSVFDSLLFYGTTTGDVASAGTRLTLANALEDARLAAASANRSIDGYYFVITAAGTITGLTGIQSYPAGAGVYYTLQFRPQDSGTSGTANTSSGALEAGDWFVIEDITGAGTVGSPYVITASVVSNTYEDATASVKGIVQLSNSTSTATTGNAVVTNGVLNGLIGTTSTTIAAGNHLHTGVYQPADASLTNLDTFMTGAGNGFIKKTAENTYSLDTNTYLTSQANDFGNVAVTTTDSGHTWGSIGTAAADTTADTLTIVDGAGVDVEVSTGTDAIRIQHTDTSTLSGAQGSAGIASITVDGFGHVTAVTTATYNNYSLPLAAAGTRGGLQLGFTSTETDRALLLSSEAGYITLPRQIPAVTLNGTSSTSPSFYAPTASGTAASTTQVKQTLVAGGNGVAPSWTNSPFIYYDTTSGSTLGDIIFDVD